MELILEEAEDEGLRRDYSEEHGERVDCRVCDSGGVGTGRVACVGKGWGIGAAARHKTHDGQVRKLIL